MKKLLYILSLLLLGLVSCNKAEMVGLDTKKAPESGLVEVTMKLTVPTELTAVTKANNRDVTPHIDHIRVAVFGTSGYPQAYAYAEPATGENQPVAKYADVNGSVFYFKVLLPVYEGEAHVHIIANGDENIQFVDMTEDKIMTTMKTTGDVGAYWARVVLPDGILTIKDENGIMQTDQESGNFIPSAETARLFEDLVLVRNFAQVTLDNDADNFVVDSWTLVNTPQYGSVAPVSGWGDVLDDNGDPVDADEDGNTDQTAVYVENYKDYVYNVKTGKMVLAELDEDGYVMDPILATYDGYMVPGSDGIVTDIPDESSWTKGTQAFVYERIDPQKVKPTCILLKGYYDGETTASYYRIDLMDENLGGYFPLYRNYNYQITISEVGNRGAADAATAMLRDSGGNVSMTAEAQTLTDISDGKSRLYVEYVDKTFATGTSTAEKTFWVYYIPDVNAKYESDVVEDGVTIHKAGDPIIDNSKITKVEMDEDPGDAIVDGTLAKDTEKSTNDGVYVYKFTLNKQDASKDLSSVFHVEANNGLTDKKKSKLVRDITVRVMKQMSMYLRFEPNPADGEADAKTVLHISLSDTLQQSMFPLEFHIEDVNHTLNPTGKDDSGLTNAKSIDVPVKTAKSLADGTTNSFYFIRTVNWSEYRPMRDAWKTAKENGATDQELASIIDFRTEFKTLVPASQTKVYVENEYFTTASVDLIKPAIRKTGTATFTGANFQAGSNRSATVGPITVNFSTISQIYTQQGYRFVEVSAGSTTTMSVIPTSSSSMLGVKITGISLYFPFANYRPTSISGSFEGGTGNSDTATYSGSSTEQPVTTDMTAGNNEFDLYSITIEYSYVEGE
ncbi:MAG: hypothetical protein IJP49_06665 [Bacteroidales bacterium]|nr:hypothetical protein [Bacteroidales bacterium]